MVAALDRVGTAAPRDGDLGRDARAAPGDADLLEGTTGGGTIWRPDPPDWPRYRFGRAMTKMPERWNARCANDTVSKPKKLIADDLRQMFPGIAREVTRGAAGAGQWLHCQSAAQCAHTRRTVPPGGRRPLINERAMKLIRREGGSEILVGDDSRS